MANKTGRDDLQSIQSAIDDYLATCATGKPVNQARKSGVVRVLKPIPPTLEGLALVLGYRGRDDLEGAIERAADENPELHNILTRARVTIICALLEGACNGSFEPRITQALLASLDSNYSTKYAVDHTVSGTITHQPSESMQALIDSQCGQLPGSTSEDE